MLTSSSDKESCDCSEDYPKDSTQRTLRVAFAYIILALSAILLAEIYYIKKKSLARREMNTLFIYAAITIAGYHSMVISQLFSALTLSCWLIVIFRLVHYSAFYWIGILYILRSMMGSIRTAFIQAGKQKFYTILNYILYISAGNGLVVLVFMARNLCGASGPIGFYFSMGVDLLNAFLLIGFLLFKCICIRLYIKERYMSHKCYYTMLMIYLITNIVLGIIYYAFFYRYTEDSTGQLVYSIFNSLVVMTFPIVIVLYFAQQPSNLEEGIWACYII